MQDLSLRLCDAQEKLTKEQLLLQKGPTPTKQLKVDAAKAKVDAIQQKLGAAQQKYIAARLKSVAKEEAALAKRQKLLDTVALRAGIPDEVKQAIVELYFQKCAAPPVPQYHSTLICTLVNSEHLVMDTSHTVDAVWKNKIHPAYLLLISQGKLDGDEKLSADAMRQIFKREADAFISWMAKCSRAEQSGVSRDDFLPHAVACVRRLARHGSRSEGRRQPEARRSEGRRQPEACRTRSRVEHRPDPSQGSARGRLRRSPSNPSRGTARTFAPLAAGSRP